MTEIPKQRTTVIAVCNNHPLGVGLHEPVNTSPLSADPIVHSRVCIVPSSHHHASTGLTDNWLRSAEPPDSLPPYTYGPVGGEQNLHIDPSWSANLLLWKELCFEWPPEVSGKSSLNARRPSIDPLAPGRIPASSRNAARPRIVLLGNHRMGDQGKQKYFIAWNNSGQ
jgi:hypothetical protein